MNIHTTAVDRLEQRMKASGTSEGAKKAWDTRGRGRKAGAKAVKPSPKQLHQAQTLYGALGVAIANAHKKLGKIEHSKTIAGKLLHLMRHVGGWLEAGTALAGMHGMIHRALQHAADEGPALMNTLQWAHQHMAPVIQHVASGMSFSGDVEGKGMAKMKGPNFRRPNPSGHVAFNVRKPNQSMHRLEGERVSQVKADIGGEPMTGNMGHAHIDPVTWFHPPSLLKRRSNESLRIPTDDPGETNDKFLDKTQRDDPKTQEFRMKMLKRSAPGGLPAQIPARTTLVSPHQGYYQPTGTGMYGAARAARSRRIGFANNRGMFVSFKNRGRI